jgi:hypothetical protein
MNRNEKVEYSSSIDEKEDLSKRTYSAAFDRVRAPFQVSLVWSGRLHLTAAKYGHSPD